jgi:hypothetical protein
MDVSDGADWYTHKEETAIVDYLSYDYYCLASTGII